MQVSIDASSLRASDWRPARFGLLSAGGYLVDAADLTPGCEIVGPNQQNVTASSGQTLSVIFRVNCAFSPEERIAFQSDPGADEDFFSARIWSVRPDGSELRQISPNFGLFPIWSPDGSRITYIGPNGLHMINYDGSENRYVENVLHSTWSPDGERLIMEVHAHDQFETPDLWMRNLDGSGMEQITQDDRREVRPAWSPDGSMLAVVVNDDLQLLDTNGSFLISLGPAQNDSWPRWSPDGSRLVFAWTESTENPSWQIWTVNVDGSNRTRLTDLDPDCGAPSYSPDGGEIIFHCPRTENEFIWRMNADGSNPRIFAEMPGPGYAHPDWIRP